ncbi:MAG TPA: EscU/YscU/HrcU family type III secretion system export apparatus switch protein [Deltaproteobacteria bacterium]|jgi:flagellar biosynthesis protein|nr:EscU/YscU/HrcU family type III secretion system export apparatus switch protein [Deltaproteobacteria bacterium]OQC27104.1 MAG: Flagellar biosynthetic protein FlhB [Deltaproteobacteria bacterium ADurb.Bin072]NMD39517.1 flagellar biosynthesis protein FlhB [Deltaproteobacteria bacterium]HNQ86303.1 EscU/YscU/HrcU family type III secretion system export apparatus switch protein [Deltaproteobacteria bacterium]HOA45175.1 EscU/YscU/HrcU family type III secretion system export apparatus switch protei
MKDKDRKAVALKYERGRDAAPKITAKGRGAVADKILALAREHGIPIEKDTTLMEALYRLDLNEQIPEELYQIVAEILAFIYRMNALKKGRG